MSQSFGATATLDCEFIVLGTVSRAVQEVLMEVRSDSEVFLIFDFEEPSCGVVSGSLRPRDRPGVGPAHRYQEETGKARIAVGDKRRQHCRCRRPHSKRWSAKALLVSSGSCPLGRQHDPVNRRPVDCLRAFSLTLTVRRRVETKRSVVFPAPEP